MLRKLAIRDAIAFTFFVLLYLALADYSDKAVWWSDFVGVVVGVGIGFCAHFLHEWGHVAGALLSRSQFTANDDMRSLSVFTYESKTNSRGQFLLMSFSGFFMTALVVWWVFSTLDGSLLAERVARGSVLFLVFLGVVLELPLVIYSLISSRVPPIDR